MQPYVSHNLTTLSRLPIPSVVRHIHYCIAAFRFGQTDSGRPPTGPSPGTSNAGGGASASGGAYGSLLRLSSAFGRAGASQVNECPFHVI